MARMLLPRCLLLIFFTLFASIEAQDAVFQGYLDSLPACSINKCDLPNVLLETCSKNIDHCGCNPGTFSLSHSFVAVSSCISSKCGVDTVFAAGKVISMKICPYLADHQIDPSDYEDSGDSESSGGLSTGAKAGIGVGVGVVVLAIIAAVIVFFILMSKKKRTRPAFEQNAQSNMPLMQQQTQYPAPTAGGQQVPWQPPGHQQNLQSQPNVYVAPWYNGPNAFTPPVSQPSSQGPLLNGQQQGSQTPSMTTPSPGAQQIYQPPPVVAAPVNPPQQQGAPQQQPPVMDNFVVPQQQVYVPAGVGAPSTAPQLPPDQDPRVAPYHDPGTGGTPAYVQPMSGTHEAQSNQLVEAPTVTSPTGQQPGVRHSVGDLYD